MKRLNSLSALLLALLLAAPPISADSGAGANWMAPGGAADESSYSRLAMIDTGNAHRLGLVASLDLPGEVSLEATPLAVDGVLYFSGGQAAVYAVDALSGRLIWKYDPQVWRYRPQAVGRMNINRGVAYEDGRVFVVSVDGRVHALDAADGRLLWQAESIDPGHGHYSTGAPRTLKGKVIIGNAGADFGMRGYVTAFDAVSGKRLWRFYTVPGSPEENRGDPTMERAAATWSGEYWNTGTGGTVWNGMTFDPELNRVYLGTGNGGPYDVTKRSPGDGDNLYLASIVALDADTGKYLWHYQMNPREAWDYKCTANIIAATLAIDGEPRRVLMQAPTNGFFYVLDRDTGKLISAEKIGKVNWAERIDLKTGRPVEKPDIRYETGEMLIFPGTTGAHNFQPMSYNPGTGLVYIPYMQLGTLFRRGAAGPGEFEFGGIVMKNVAPAPGEGDGRGQLIAWDPVRQEARWRVQHETLWNSGTLATAGGLVFQGTADGSFGAWDGATGEQLWQFPAGLGMIGGVSSFAVDGRQYVAVLTGYGASASVISQFMDVGWRYGAQPRRLLVFGLDGRATLAPSPPPDLRVYAVDDPEVTIAAADIAPGRRWYTWTCSPCHGQNLNSAGGPAPDLRESATAIYEESLWTLLQGGELLPRGMPRFEQLGREQVRQIHAYIRSGAREALAAGDGRDPALR